MVDSAIVSDPGAAGASDLSRGAAGGAFSPVVRRWLSVLVIVVAAAQGLAHLLTASVMYSPARWPENRPPHTPLFSANDRSRWCTVWSLAERGTYQIDEIIRQNGWDTIDKVYFEGHFYSSKPPLLPTLVAVLYRVVKWLFGLDLLASTHETVQVILLLVNWAPWIAALALLAGMLERYARTDWSRLFAIIAAASGTFLTTFLVTFNNHTVAATSVVFALAPALRILLDGRRDAWRFALAGFWSALAVTCELPAFPFGGALFGLLYWKAPGPTLRWFVPAALVPLGAFFYTNWLCTGRLLPFYASFGAATNDYYKYVIDGVPSYWMTPSAIDRGEASGLTYLWHCTFGHHGMFSLSPVLLLTAIGWLRLRRDAAAPLRIVVVLSLALTLWTLAFYLLQTNSYNYGGVSSGLRWSFWLTPLWILGLVPALDAWGGRRGVRALAAACLAVSVFSATYPRHNPWQQPWLYQLLGRWGGALPAATPDPDLPPPRRIWLGRLPEPSPGDEPSWIEFSGESGEGRTLTLRLETAPAADSPPARLISVRQSGALLFPEAGSTSASVTVDAQAWQEGRSPEAVVRPSGDEPAGILRDAQRFLAGLPRAAEYRPGPVRYLKTPLRHDAFACRIAAASVSHRSRPDGTALRYRRSVWWSAEVPFGVLQVEDTVTDPRDNAVLYRQRLTASRVSGLLPPER